jgi:hypothetical protein
VRAIRTNVSGYRQTDPSVSKNWTFNGTSKPSNDTFGQILSARALREIQLGVKFYW